MRIKTVLVAAAASLLVGCFTPKSQWLAVQQPGARSPGDYSGLESFLATPKLVTAGQVKRWCRQKSPVRVLIWGQSIAEQFSAEAIKQQLQSTRDGCEFEVRNAARGGCVAQCLTGEIPWRAGGVAQPVDYFAKDVIPFRPQLVIFHVYGSHIAYNELMARFHQETKARVLLLTDHISAQPDTQSWSDTMAWQHLPAIAADHGFVIADSRLAWRQYLYETNLPPQALLRDKVHLNQEGEALYLYFISHALVGGKNSSVAVRLSMPLLSLSSYH
ncbi:hypothetical protein [Halioxenophilus aromaticivorans]|uniref:SGNH domain-containing protein n=1 Tax=Halioxenophilus aromaticivorans TaxID=1306992 RepID=A0AAV3U0D7_9ALTE